MAKTVSGWPIFAHFCPVAGFPKALASRSCLMLNMGMILACSSSSSSSSSSISRTDCWIDYLLTYANREAARVGGCTTSPEVTVFAVFDNLFCCPFVLDSTGPSTAFAFSFSSKLILPSSRAVPFLTSWLMLFLLGDLNIKSLAYYFFARWSLFTYVSYRSSSPINFN